MSENHRRIADLVEQIASLPQGNVTYKKINGKEQPYLQWTEKGKSKSKYIKITEREMIISQVELRRKLQEELKTLKAFTPIPEKKSPAVSFETNVITGSDLYAMTDGVRNWKKRDCFVQLQNYINGSGYDRVCLLYGLRRTGKTTMLRQTLYEMSDEQFAKAALIQNISTKLSANLVRLQSAASFIVDPVQNSIMVLPIKMWKNTYVSCNLTRIALRGCL